MGSPPPFDPCPQPLELPGDNPAQFGTAGSPPAALTPPPAPTFTCTSCAVDNLGSELCGPSDLHQKTSCACHTCGNTAVNVREGVALCSRCLDLSDDEAIRRVPPRAHIDVKILTDYSDSGVAGVAGAPGVGTEDLAAGLTKFACQSLPDVEALDVHGCLRVASYAECFWADSTKPNFQYARAVSQGLNTKIIQK